VVGVQPAPGSGRVVFSLAGPGRAQLVRAASLTQRIGRRCRPGGQLGGAAVPRPPGGDGR